MCVGNQGVETHARLGRWRVQVDSERRMRYRVRGASMYPALRDGDVVDVDLDAFTHRAPRPGEVVLAKHPFKRDVLLVKRVVAVGDDGRIDVRGDEPIESEDSRGFGPLRPEAIVGLVLI
jgi:nickel-type superoxide dismutase maturation protease